MEGLLDFIKGVDPLWMYIILCAGAYVENIFPPTPGDTLVVFGAYLVGIGTLNFELVFFATTVGSLAGFITMYGLGRIFGTKFVESGKWRFFSSELFVFERLCTSSMKIIATVYIHRLPTHEIALI